MSLNSIRAKVENAPQPQGKTRRSVSENPITLKDLVVNFYSAKCLSDEYKKKVDVLKDKIKDLMEEQGLSTFEEDGYCAKRSESVRTTMVEERVLQKLHDLGLDEGDNNCIAMVEKPDEPKIESLIYDNKLDAKELEDCSESKTVVTLTVKKKAIK